MRREQSDGKKRAMAVWGVTICLLLGSIAALLWMKHTKTEGGYALIYQKGELIRRIDLTDVEKPYQVRIEGSEGAYNVLEVRNGSIGMVDASCPDKLCENMGFIKNSLMPVTCMPNQIVVRVDSGEQEEPDAVDGVSY